MLTEIIKQGYLRSWVKIESDYYGVYRTWLNENQKVGAILDRSSLIIYNRGPQHFPRPLRDRLRAIGDNAPEVGSRSLEDRTAYYYFNRDIPTDALEAFARSVLSVIRYYQDYEFSSDYDEAMAHRPDGEQLAADW